MFKEAERKMIVEGGAMKFFCDILKVVVLVLAGSATGLATIFLFVIYLPFLPPVIDGIMSAVVSYTTMILVNKKFFFSPSLYIFYL